MRILCCPSGNRKGQKGETGREEKKKRERRAILPLSRLGYFPRGRRWRSGAKRNEKRGNKEAPGLEGMRGERKMRGDERAKRRVGNGRRCSRGWPFQGGATISGWLFSWWLGFSRRVPITRRLCETVEKRPASTGLRSKEVARSGTEGSQTVTGRRRNEPASGRARSVHAE